MTDQQETGVVEVPESPPPPVGSSSYLSRDVIDAKSGPGVTSEPPLIPDHQDNFDLRIGQSTVPVTPIHPVAQVSDAKFGPGIEWQPQVQSNYFQQQTVPVTEEFELPPIPEAYQQQTVPIPEEHYETFDPPITESDQQQTVPRPEEIEEPAAPRYESRPPSIPEAHERDIAISHGAASTATLASPSSSIEKPPLNSEDDLDEDGFTSGERREQQRTIQHLRKLRYVMYSRWLIRIVSAIVSVISFALILVTIVLYVKSDHAIHPHDMLDARGQYDNVDIRPSAAFAAISGVFSIISIAVTIGCCFSQRIRRVSLVSNAIFATLAIVGLSCWLSGCFYLHHNSKGRNLWYYVCVAAKQYHHAQSRSDAVSSSSSSSSSSRRRRQLLPRAPGSHDSQGLDVLSMCTYTEKAWDMGIAQACFEILTLVNVIIALVIVKWSWIRLMIKRGKVRLVLR